jgi:hypothetical protein
VRSDRIGEDVRAVGVRAAVVLRPRLPLAVGLDEEAAEVGDRAVDLVGLALPPRGDARVGGIRGGKPAQELRRREVRGQVDAEVVGPEGVGERFRLRDSPSTTTAASARR